MSNMEQAHHRSHQSLDTTRSRAIGHLDSPAGWRQQSTPRAVSGHNMPSPIWTLQPGEARMLHHQQLQQQQQQPPPPSQQQQQLQHQLLQQHQQQRSASTHYVADTPSPAQANFQNSWMSQTVGKYAYYLDRGNGYVTRLIPADVLPLLNEIPPQEATSAGMEVLQPLRGAPPAGVQDMNQRVTFKNGGRLAKRDKLYCDKWVHEGICAFEQQGCRYLHDMPSDKATQIALGLFQGYPAWWRKHQADLQRQHAPLGTHQIEPHQQHQHGPYGTPTAPRALPSSAKEALANSEPDDTPTNGRTRDWRRNGPASATAGSQGNRRTGRAWSTDATAASYQYPLGAIEPPVQRKY